MRGDKAGEEWERFSEGLGGGSGEEKITSEGCNKGADEIEGWGITGVVFVGL